MCVVLFVIVELSVLIVVLIIECVKVFFFLGWLRMR